MQVPLTTSNLKFVSSVGQISGIHIFHHGNSSLGKKKKLATRSYLEVAVTKAPAFRRKISLAAAADMLLIDMVAMLGAVLCVGCIALDVAVLESKDEGGKGCMLYALRPPHGMGA